MGYADGTWALSGTLPFARPEGLALRLERYGTPHLHARWEGGAYLGFSLPPSRGGGVRAPGPLPPPRLRRGRGEPPGGTRGALPGPGGGVRGGALPPLGQGGPAGARLRPLPGVQGGPLDPGGSSPPGVPGLGPVGGGPLRPEAGGAGGANPGLALSGSYAFRLPVPEEVTLALGGYEEVPVEGRVEVEGRPVKGGQGAGRGEGGGDRRGGALPPLPPAGGRGAEGRAAGEPPRPPRRGLLAPGGARPGPGPPPCLRPPPPVRGRGPGAYLVGKVGVFVPCGGEAVLPPGAYRLLPQGLPGYRGEEGEVRLEALAREEVVLSFVPVPTEALPEARPLRVEWPAVVAPGEVARVRVLGAEEAEFSLPLLRKEASEGGLLLYFQVPWEAEGALPLEVRAGGRRERRLVPVDKARPLLVLRLSPPRARLGRRWRRASRPSSRRRGSALGGRKGGAPRPRGDGLRGAVHGGRGVLPPGDPPRFSPRPPRGGGGLAGGKEGPGGGRLLLKGP